MTYHTPRNEMPEDPVARGQWAMEKLMTDLQQAKMWPVKLAHLKHQDALSNMACCSNYGCVSAKLTICFLCAKARALSRTRMNLNHHSCSWVTCA